MEQLNEDQSRQVHKTARNKPRHASFIYLAMGRGIWQTYVSHHQPQKSADLTMQSGAKRKGPCGLAPSTGQYTQVRSRAVDTCCARGQRTDKMFWSRAQVGVGHEIGQL